MVIFFCIKIFSYVHRFVFFFYWFRLKINHKNEIKEFENELKKMYIDIAARRRRTMIEEMNLKLIEVMKNWIGLSMEEVFIEWRNTVKLGNKRRQKDKKNEIYAAKIAYQGDMARLELAQNEVMIDCMQYLFFIIYIGINNFSFSYFHFTLR